MKRILFTLIALASLLTACTDQNEVEIAYRSEGGITAAHIFDGYEPYQENDFNMNADGWKLNLTLFVYNEQGELIDRAEKLCSSLSDVLAYDKYLAPGNYTFISIADFREGLGGADYKFWNITNENNIKDLSITENENIYPVVFETLGLDIQELSVTDVPVTISADIRPITALVHIYENNDDLMSGFQGFSRFAPVCAGYFIRSDKFKNTVKVEDGAFSAGYSEQISEYNLAISKVCEDWLAGRSSLRHSYRALLPDNDCLFKWHIQKNELEDDDPRSKYSGNIKTDGVSNQTISLLSGKQYVLSMILDCLSLYVFEYPEKFKAKEYAQRQVDDFCKKSIDDEYLSYNFESILERGEDWANVFLGAEPYLHAWGSELYLAYYPRPGIDRFEMERTVGYLNERVDCVVIVQFMLPNMSDDIVQYFRQKLGEKYRVDHEYTSPNNYCFLNPDSSVDSRYRIVLQKIEKNIDTYFLLSYILRDAYAPKEEVVVEDLWADFTTLFGADMYKVNSTLKDFGYSYLTSDYTYSVNGSDYYFTSNNEYSDMVGFVYNTDNQVSEYWVYYKPAKVDDIRKYLNLKYTSAPNENTSFKDVFYNSARDMRVALDIANGAVIYTKLDMTQHVNPADK